MSDRLHQLQVVWESQAQADPLWAVLSEPDRLGRRWDLHSFLRTGEEFVSAVLGRFDGIGESPDGSLALDFGCGVGRLTQPLGDRFERVVGVDISPTMVAAARRINRHGDRVEYVVNARPDLSFVGTNTVDFLLSHIVLQHIEPDLTRGYLAEFCRVVRPGGLLFFQLPSHYADSYLPTDRDDTPVAPAAARADLSIVDAPTTMTAGEAVSVQVRVTNTSGSSWTQSATYPLHVGNHWLDRTGRMVANDDGRARLPGRLAAGRSADVTLTVRAPSAPGEYVVVVDVVQEGVRWFDGPGLAGVSVEVAAATVGPPAILAPSVEPVLEGVVADEWFEPPAFEMHGIHRDEVEHIIRRLGGTVLAADEHVTEWHSFGYFVRIEP
jgi:hypothetical protein